MLLSVALRYNNTEYQTTYVSECSFGGGKTDSVKIPELSDTLVSIRNNGSMAVIHVKQPLSPCTTEVAYNDIIHLSSAVKSSLYISRVTGDSKEGVELPYNGTVLVGRSSDNDIVLSYPIISRKHFKIQSMNGSAYVEDLNSTCHLYLNGKQIQRATLKSGDILSIYTFCFIYREGKLYFRNMGDQLTVSPKLKKSGRYGGEEQIQPQEEIVKPKVAKGKQTSAPKTDSHKAVYLKYHLSPRIREQLPSEGLILSSAPGAATAPGGRQGNLAYLISTGAMFAASMASGLVSPAMLLMRAAGFISPIANMAMFGKMSKEEKQQYEEYEKMRHERYQAYMAEQKARIKKIADVQRRITTNENPEPNSCVKTVEKLTRNLWERNAEDSDFLVTRIGIGQVPLCVEVKTRADVDGFKLIEEDELEQLSAKIIEETRFVDNMPVCVDFRRYQMIGLTGEEEAILYLLRSIIVELVTQHNFSELHLVGLFDEADKSNFGMLRWLPHIWDESGQSRYLAFEENRRHVVCEMLKELIRNRRMEAENAEYKSKSSMIPHYVVIVRSRKLMEEEDVYQDLLTIGPKHGITVLILGESMYDLPQKTQVLLECISRSRCNVYEKDKYDKRLECSLDEVIHRQTMDYFCRRMAAIELASQKSKAAIPSAVTFLQGFHVKSVEELDVWNRWNSSKPYLSLAAPIGVMEGGKMFALDVRSGEQSHGPHGLLAGTTGSGKSELLQSWILSMALNYHPYDVNFVIIDYKGGGMSDLMEPLPHVVGKITNIDRNITRSLVALKSELRRRQELFAKYSVNNIDKYQRAYDNGIVKERLPHLIIVTDEFAEMKKEEPDFMTELNSVATIGRSLGIHMLLATQKPSGVVTDQINSNSRFRICMKVQDVADSREMLKRADAAKITQAGRAYIRIGEDEQYELFQSFYSGAEYTGGKDSYQNHQNQARIVSSTGERITVSKGQKKRSSDTIDELTAVTNYIQQVCKQHGIEKMSGPWLPELKRWLTMSDLGVLQGFDGNAWPEEMTGLSVPIGQYDIPALQKQGIQYIDFMEYGHFGIFGMPGSGKTTLLKTIVANLGQYYTPERVEITILDASNWSMKEFETMPHVREVILNQETDKLMKFIQRMEKELTLRKSIFLKAAVTSLKSYWETVSADLPAMVIVIDYIEPLFEQYMEVGDILTEIATAGAAFGMYLVFTANSTMGIKYKFLQLVKGNIALSLADKGDYGSIVGPIHGISLPNVPGRALFCGNPPIAFQTAVYVDEKGDKERSEALQKLFHSMKWVRNQKKEIEMSAPVMEGEDSERPEEESSVKRRRSFNESKGVSKKASDVLSKRYPEEPRKPMQTLGRGMVQIGKDANNFDPVLLDLVSQHVLLISSESPKRRKEFFLDIHDQLARNSEHQILLPTAENQSQIRTMLEENLNKRKDNKKQHKNSDAFDQTEWMKGFTQICLLIDDFDAFAEKLDDADMKFYRRVMTKSDGLGISIVISASKNIFNGESGNMLIDAVRESEQILAADGRPAEYVLQGILEDPEADMELDPKEAALICRNSLKMLRI